MGIFSGHSNPAYPLDLDGSLDYTRFAKVAGVHPYPSVIGHVSGFMPLLDVLQLSPVSNAPWGAGVGTPQPVDFTQYTGQVTFPDLQKVRG